MKFETVVVGAGPAGSTAAKFLSEKGVKVLLIDKQKFPREKLCGGAIPYRILNKYKYIDDKLIESKIFGAILYLTSLKDKVSVEIDYPMHALVLRKKFDNSLVKYAQNSGATFLEKTGLKDIKITENKVKIIADNGSSYDSDLIVGADGIWSRVAKKYGLNENFKNFGICAVQQIPLSGKIINQYFSNKKSVYIHMKFCGLNGYGWVFPKNKHLNIGVVELRLLKNDFCAGVKIKEVFKKYVKTIKNEKIIPQDLKLDNPKCAPLPACHIGKTYSNRLILCGDAAGLINLGGGGIGYAMSSGEIAANVIADALLKGNTSEKYLSKYQKYWYNDFGKDIRFFEHMQKRFGTKTEKYLQLASKDSKITKLLLEIITENSKLHENKFRLSSRFFYLYLKNLF